MLLAKDSDICKGIRHTVGWVVTDENKVTSKKPKLVSTLICALCEVGGGISHLILCKKGHRRTGWPLRGN